MFKKSFKFSALIVCVVLSCLLLTACDFSFLNFNVTVKALETPLVGLDRENKQLNWRAIERADRYNIYINDELVTSVDNDSSEFIQSYDFADNLDNFGYYKLKVQALSESNNFKKSNASTVITYVYANSKHQEIVTDYDIVYGDLNKSPADINSASKDITWSKVDDANYYVVITYTTTDGVVVNSTNRQYFDISNNTNGDEIILFSIGAYFEEEDKLYIKSPIQDFYNPYSQGQYTENVYVFDGYVGDHYIQSINELANVTYYHLINRTASYDVRFSESFLQDAQIGEGNINKEILNKIDYCFSISDQKGPFFETCQFESVNKSFGKKKDENSQEHDYQIAINYFGVEECDIEFSSTNYSYTLLDQNQPEHPYYKNYEGKAGSREADYNDFVSDKYFVAQQVDTSEQLYWAVENKVTPIVVEGSRAELIYQMAKDVLKEIIHPDMTDYEKALSIFDWITVNTIYDSGDIENIHYLTKASGQKTIYITDSPSYYLEGVFITGEAVCDGFSKAYSLLCNMEGIECIRIAGMAGTGGRVGAHAWNIVGIDGNYYLVDITWTEIKAEYLNAPGGKEYLTHKYFLFTNDSNTPTHRAHPHREKFFNYSTSLSNYSYYKNTEVTYKNQNGTSITEDFVIESDTELHNLMHYFLVSNTVSADVVFTKEYVIELILRMGLNYIDGDTIKDALFEAIKTQKNPIQMLDVVGEYQKGFYLYDNSGVSNKNYGITVYMGFNLMIDEQDELKDFVNYIDEIAIHTPSVKENVYFNFYINESIVAGINIQQEINEHINQQQLADKIEIEYTNKYRQVVFDTSEPGGKPETIYSCKLIFK